jgi:predicted nucleic acid-binding protein
MFEAEPLVAHASDEPGAERTAEYLDAVGTDEIEGHLTRINATEVRYVIARMSDTDRADRYLRWLAHVGVTPIGADELWRSG